MADTAIRRLVASRRRQLRRRTGEELAGLRDARGLSLTEVAAEAGIDRRWLARAEAGEANLTLDALAAVATVLGTEPSVRLFQATGPRLRDRLQVAMLDTLLSELHPRWQPRLEVPVYRPARGVIDLVLVERGGPQVASGEAHSEIRRAEQQLRWQAEKTDSLPSADGWPWGAAPGSVSRLLVLRSTAATRSVVAGAPHLFTAAYPGATRDAVAALRGGRGALPVAAIVWIEARGTAGRLLEGPPRGVDVGR